MPRRRARPTLRVLREDLAGELGDAHLGRALAEGRLTDLQPLSDIPHPIVAKASSAFGEESSEDHHDGRIRCVSSLPILEIRSGQWRGGVWIAQDGVCWLIACGLAKGGHQDHDDFYEVLGRVEVGPGAAVLKPAPEDLLLWKQEVASEVLATWDLVVQTKVAEALSRIHQGGETRFDVEHPMSDRLEPGDRTLSTVTVEVVQVDEGEDRYEDVVVTLETPARWLGSQIEWQLIRRVLITISPPEQGWDRYKHTFATMSETGALSARIAVLADLGRRGAVAESEPGQHAHHTHKRDLTDRTINGQAVRAICGAFFVPSQDHVTLPTCPTCDERIAELPA